MQVDKSNYQLPRLKRDLKIYQGPNAEDGSPTYSLHNTTVGNYYQLSWEQALLIRLLKPGMTIKELKEAIEANSTLKPEEEELWEFFMYANAHGLLEKRISGKQVYEGWRRMQMGPISWLIKHYLYFRIPLLRPDRFLQKTLPIVNLLASKPAIIFYVTVTMLGIFLLVGQLDNFLHTFSQFLSWKGALAYALTHPITKVIHEFSHAYVAKAQGVNVTTMGIAFMVFHPVAYCDVTDGWKLSKRSKRIMITIAGVLSEVVLAGLATVGWVFSEPGLLKNMFFIIASTNWISSLFVNLNPVMRFDGYYLLSDLLGIDNLQSRAFGWTRWKLREIFFGFGFEPPEDFSIRRQFGVFIYTIATWIYRFFLYLGIAIMVYYITNIKPLALFLFGIEMIVFVLRPFYIELVALKNLRKEFSFNYRLATTVSILIGALIWVTLPFSRSQSIAAVVVPKKEIIIYAPSEGGMVSEISTSIGSEVYKGQKLLQLTSPEIENSIKQYENEVKILQREITLSEVSENKGNSHELDERALLLEKQAELAKALAELEGLMELRKRNNIISTINGIVNIWNDKMHAGQFLARRQIIGKISSKNKKKIIAFVPEKFVNNLKIGDIVNFYGHFSDKCEGIITKIEKVRTKYLEYPQLASIYKHKAPLEVAPEGNHQLRLIDTYYEMEIVPDKESASKFRLGQIGSVKIKTEPYSYVIKLLQNGLAIFHRESSF